MYAPTGDAAREIADDERPKARRAGRPAEAAPVGRGGKGGRSGGSSGAAERWPSGGTGSGRSVGRSAPERRAAVGPVVGPRRDRRGAGRPRRRGRAADRRAAVGPRAVVGSRPRTGGGAVGSAVVGWTAADRAERDGGARVRAQRAARRARPTPQRDVGVRTPRCAPGRREPRRCAPAERAGPAAAAVVAAGGRANASAAAATKPGPRPSAGNGRGTARAAGAKRLPPDVEPEIRRLGGRRAEYYLGPVHGGRAEAFASDRDRAALRILRPLRDVLPDAPSVRELTGLARVPIGNYRAAAKELEAFVELTDSVEQHPVLMDCYRAQQRWKRVDELWARARRRRRRRPTLVTEGRIVLRRRRSPTTAASTRRIDLLRRKAEGGARTRRSTTSGSGTRSPTSRSGPANLAGARELFARVRQFDPDFADVAERRANLR